MLHVAMKNKKRSGLSHVYVIYFRRMFYRPIQLKPLTEHIKQNIGNWKVSRGLI